MQTFTDLADMARRASDADRDLDALIAMTVLGYSEKIGRWLYRTNEAGRQYATDRYPAYTSEISAVMSIAGTDERRIEFGTYENGTAWAYVYLNNADGECVGEAEGVNETLALLTAMLTAKALRILRAEPTEAEIEREAMPYSFAAPKEGNRYSVEEQADGTHAVFINGGFARGGYAAYARDAALAYADGLAADAERCGVPVASRAV